jgi:protein phosphatase 1 regulatory subunit 7
LTQASYNKVTEWGQVEKELKKDVIKTVYLEGNPISKDAMYRFKLKSMLDSLVQIDATLVRQ